MNAFPKFPEIRFSCALDLGFEAELSAALDLHQNRLNDIGFVAEPFPHSKTAIWFHDREGQGDLDQLIAFVCECARSFGLAGLWCFRWSGYDSRFTLDAASGGYYAIDLKISEIIRDPDYSAWIVEEFCRLRTFIIYSETEGASYWSNEHGWTDLDSATEFSLTERLRNKLPDSRYRDAKWIEIPIPPLGAEKRR